MAHGIVSKETAHRIWMAHHEIEAGEKLLADIQERVAKGEDPNPIDGFGRSRKYQLGAPYGENTHKLLDVSPILAASVIRAHIADKRNDLAHASIAAAVEVNGTQASEATLDSLTAIRLDGPGFPR